MYYYKPRQKLPDNSENCFKIPFPSPHCWTDLIAQLMFHFSSNLNIEFGGKGKIQLVWIYFGQDCASIPFMTCLCLLLYCYFVYLFSVKSCFAVCTDVLNYVLYIFSKILLLSFGYKKSSLFRLTFLLNHWGINSLAAHDFIKVPLIEAFVSPDTPSKMYWSIMSKYLNKKRYQI